MTQFHTFDPALGHGLPHDPLKAIIAPRPIGWISSISANGVTNLAPYSFFNMVSSYPPILMFSSEGRKDTVANIEATGCFVFNLATRHQAEAMNTSSGAFGADADEFELAGLDKLASEAIAAPRVGGAPVSMECKLISTQKVKGLDGVEPGNILVFGQVVRVHIDRAFLTADGLFDIVAAGTLARCGYRGDYVAVSETFEMLRP